MAMNVEQPKTGGRHRRTETYGRNMTNEEKAYYYSLESSDAFDLLNLRKYTWKIMHIKRYSQI